MVVGLGYEPTDQLLEIEFRNGKTYQYNLVPPSVYTDFLAASSPGDFFLRRVRSRYPFRQIR